MGGVILRSPGPATATRYDVVIIGGGIYGVALALEAVRRNLSALLLERDDFGGATSWSSLRVVHGGLRHLRKFDLRSFVESVRERAWLCDTFPDLVTPFPFLLPVDNRTRSWASVVGAGLAANDYLTRLSGGRSDDSAWRPSRMIGVDETRQWFPTVDGRGLRGGALWHDAVMANSQRVLIEMLRWACGLGARALNYVEVTGLLADRGMVRGVVATDRLTGAGLEFRGNSVVNCAGPWAGSVAARFGMEVADLFRPSLAFNVLLDRRPLSAAALAVTPKKAGGRVHLLYPCRGKILAGTGHVPCVQGGAPSPPTEAQLAELIRDLNEAVPGFDVHGDHVVRTYAGWLPARRPGTTELSSREVIYDHGQAGGPRGLVSISGVKFTTARLVAEKALRVLLRRPGGTLPAYRPGSERMRSLFRLDLNDPAQLLLDQGSWIRAELARLVEEEAVVEVDDLLLRRTDWGADPRQYPEVRKRVDELLDARPVSHPSSAGATRATAAAIGSR